MKAGLYMHEAKNVSAVMGRKSDVKVSFGGTEAGTDGNLIRLPAVNQGKDMSDVEVKVARGYVDHEAAHVKWTTKDYKRATLKVVESQPTEHHKKIAKATMNALEDVRIEERLIDTYAGSKENLDAVADAAADEVMGGMEPEQLREMTMEQIGPLAVTWFGRGRQSYGRKGAELFTQLSEDVQNAVMDICDGLNKDSTPEDMIERVTKMMKYVEEQPPEEEQQPDDGDGDGDGKSGGGEGLSSGEGGGKETESEGDGKRSEGSGREVSSDEMIDPDEAMKDAVEGALASDEDDEGNKFVRWSDERDRVYSKEELIDDGRRYDKITTDMVGQINVVRRKLERMLMARMKRDWRGGKLRGRLDTRRLVGAYGGEENVFKLRDDDDELDTAVCILIDHSGSMRGSRIKLAQKAAIALAESLEPTPIKTSVVGFKTERLTGKEFRKIEEAGYEKFSSLSPLATFVYKDYGDPLHRCRGAMGGMVSSFDNIAGVQNVDGSSVELVAGWLAKRPEKRKVLFVLSDGMPEDEGWGGSDMRWHLKQVIKEVESNGIEVFGIGIQTSAVKRFYEKHVVLHDIGELDRELIDRMSNVLIGGDWDARRVAS